MIKEAEKVKGSSREANEGTGREEKQETKRKVRRTPKTQAAAAPEKKSQRETDDEKDVTFVVPEKNARSLNSSDRTEELIREAEDCKWDALLLCETWRPNKAEIWESRQGHMYMGAGTFDNKHGVAILLNRKLAQKNKSGSKHQRACLRNIDHSQQAANYVDGCLHIPPTRSMQTHIETSAQFNRENHELQENHANRMRESSTLNLVFVLALNASVLERIPSKNQTAQEIG